MIIQGAFWLRFPISGILVFPTEQRAVARVRGRPRNLCHLVQPIFAFIQCSFHVSHFEQVHFIIFSRVSNLLGRTRVWRTFVFGTNMGFMLADRAWFWCISCVFSYLTIYASLPKRIGDKKFRLEFAQRLTSALHAIWMFFGAIDCWARGECTLRNGAEVFKGHLSIADFSPSIDERIDHMLGYLIADQVSLSHQFCSGLRLHSHFAFSDTRCFNRPHEVQLLNFGHASRKRLCYNFAPRCRHRCSCYMPPAQSCLICAIHVGSVPCGRFNPISACKLDYERCRFG